MAKYDGLCGGCGGAIRAGQQVEWSRGQRARHTSCAGQGQRTAARAPMSSGRRALRAAYDGDYTGGRCQRCGGDSPQTTIARGGICDDCV